MGTQSRKVLITFVYELLSLYYAFQLKAAASCRNVSRPSVGSQPSANRKGRKGAYLKHILIPFVYELLSLYYAFRP